MENFERERHIFDLYFAKGMGRLSVITSNIFRVQYTIQKSWTYKPLLSIEEKEWKSVPLQIKRHKEKLDITTPKLLISLVFQPFNIRVYDHDGHILSQDNPRASVVLKGPRIIVNKKCPANTPIIGLGDLPGPIDRSGRLHRLEMAPSEEKDLKAHNNPQLVFPLFCYQSKGICTGYFLDNATSGLIDFRRSSLGEFAMATDDGELDYYWLIGNDVDEVAQGFHTLIGNSAFPPRWSLEIIKGLEAPFESKSFMKKFDPVRRDFVATSSVMVHQPPGDPSGFWDERPAKMIKGFRRSDKIPHFMLELDQKLPLAKTDPNALAKLESQQQVLTVEGVANRILSHEGAAYLDPFYEKSYHYLQEKLHSAFRDGLRGLEIRDACPPWTKKDLFGTSVRCVQEIIAEDGENIEKLVHEIDARKLRGYMANGLMRGLFKAGMQSRPELRPLLVSSSGFAGIQRYSVIRPAHATMTWVDMPRYITRLLNLSVSGAPLLCCDISFDNDLDESFTTRLVYALAFVPLIRLRFSQDYDLKLLQKNERLLHALDEVFNLRESWLPYLYHLIRKAHTFGAPILYPTAYYFPAWAPSHGMQSQFLVGPHLLACPSMRKECGGQVELPPGDWAHAESFKVFEGKKRVTLDEDDEMPLFYREGAVVPRYDNSVELLKKSVIVTCFPKNEATTETQIYDDDGESNRYKSNEYSCIQMRMSSTHKGCLIKIARRQGRQNPSWSHYLLRFIRSRLDIQRVVYNRTELEYYPSLDDLLKQKMGFHIDEDRELLYVRIPYEREGGVLRF